MFIEGIAIGGYRSLGTPQKIGPCRKVNLLVGPNNCGKSNVLLFLTGPFRPVVDSLRQGSGQTTYRFQHVEKHVGKQSNRFTFGLGATLGGRTAQTITEREPSIKAQIEKLFQSQTLCQKTNLAWFPYDATSPGQQLQFSEAVLAELVAEQVLPPRAWRNVWNKLTNRDGGDLERHWVPETLRKLSPVQVDCPPIRRVAECLLENRQVSGGHVLKFINQQKAGAQTPA
jgi:hypothetical protein